jgi:hypothetical protein
MKRLSLFAALLLSLAAGPVLAADAPAKKPVSAATKAAKAMKPSLGEKGRLHALHKSEDVECKDCHSKTDVDPLFLRAAESQGSEGPVNRENCLDCHKSPKKPTWYVGVKK